MSDPLSSLEPRSVWGHFSALAAIPRPSGHEERAAEYVDRVAAEHGFEVSRDGAGNRVVRVPATAGREGAPPIVLQGHLDMVCEKNKSVSHDFMRDAIRTRIDGEWVAADGTTLGADNGIGVAAALAAATDPGVAHGPLELLFTIDEETGLTGAKELDASLIGGRTLLNLDSEEDGVIYVGCAGGADTHLEFAPDRAGARAGTKPYRLDVGGLRGGHSGLNIHENRGNAVRLAARILAAAIEDGLAVDLERVAGGDKHNAIPREAEAVFHLDPADEKRLRGVLARQEEGFRTELGGIDDGLEIRLGPATDASGRVLASPDRDTLVRALLALPHGVLAMSRDIPGLVETSSNLAAIREHDGSIVVLTSSRSSVMSSLAAVLGQITAVGRLAGADVEVEVGYPGWKPDLDSAVLQVVRTVYGEVWGRPAEVTAIHAGLECGLIGEKIPGIDMVSFGPQIEGAHSPDERVSVPAVARFWDALGRVLDRLSKG